MDTLRPLDQLFNQDTRWKFWEVYDPVNQKTRPFTLHDLHGDIQTVGLRSFCPAEVVIQFEQARNLMLYSWLVYRFSTIAALHALTTLELALKLKCRLTGRLGSGRSLRPLLEIAVAERWINDNGFRNWHHTQRRREQYPDLFAALSPQGATVGTYCSGLVEAIPRMRNVLAHGSETLIGPHALTILEVCADLINQLFLEQIKTESVIPQS